MVKCGIDVIEKYAKLFENKRIGLITAPSGVTKDLKSTIDLFYKNFNLTALYSPEHGVRGEFQAGEEVKEYIDERTGIKVYSLYGKTKNQLQRCLRT